MNFIKILIKTIIIHLHPFSNLMYLFTKEETPFLCIITPIFDPALQPLKSLVHDLQTQSFPHFIHVSISNGLSPHVKKYITELSKKDSRFKYDEIKGGKINGWQEILLNIGRRRTYAMKKYTAMRYIFIDGDSSIASNSYIAKLYCSHITSKKEIIITQTKFPDSTVLPFFPINIGRIDITNYSFSHAIAQGYPYPHTIDPHFGPANDFRYFKEINKKNSTIYFPFLGILKNNKKSYKNLGKMYYESLK